jgi:hypothetical protein
MEISKHLNIGIGSADDAPRCELELPHEGTRRNRSLIDLLDLHVGPDLFPELLQHLAVGAAARSRCRDHLEIDRLAVVLDQRLRLLDIVSQSAVILALDPGAVAIGIGGRPREAIGENLGQLLAIERRHQRLPRARRRTA